MSRLRSVLCSLVLALCLATPALAASGDVARVQNFAQNVIEVLVTLAGLVAAGFFVVGGIGYITSSGNPEHLDRSKKTIVWSGVGLAICIGAFVLSNIIGDLATSAFK
ncbi:TrbC/VirB2 family protein [Patescibacteria group bacterium]|nr:TrbC/VirB2 family protein [Patescibacteria group bacterium]